MMGCRGRKLLWIVPVLWACSSGGDSQSDTTLEPSDTQAAQTLDRAASVAPDSTFAGLIERISEPGGYFDTDNLISNESSYLHVMGALDRLGLQGGAYIGVGPDQNFSYIAQIRPEAAFIIDVRRDNMLQHLLFRALFLEARNRLGYLTLLYGRPVPESPDVWDERSLTEIVAYVDSHESEPDLALGTRARVQARARSFGVPLSEADLATIDRFHRAFIEAGLDLRFTSYGRRPRFFYPTHRDLLLETDLDGSRASYLVSEDDFQFLKGLQAEGRIVPVVGDLGGSHALREVGRVLDEMRLRMTAFYTSNVEFYLWGDGAFDRFANNVTTLPMSDSAVIIRSYFGGGFRGAHPQSVQGYYSTQMLQRVASFMDVHRGSGFRGYSDLITRDLVELR